MCTGFIWLGLGISDRLLWTEQMELWIWGEFLNYFLAKDSAPYSASVCGWVSVCVCVFEWICSYVNNHITITTITKVVTNRFWKMQLYAGQMETNFWTWSLSTQWEFVIRGPKHHFTLVWRPWYKNKCYKAIYIVI